MPDVMVKKNKKNRKIEEKKLARERPIVHKTYSVKTFREGFEGVITPEMAMKWLGWEVMKDGDKRKVHLVDKYENKIHMTNDEGNRRLRINWVEALAQEILHHNWHFNSENVIIGQTARVLSGQHRLIALVLAEQMRVLEEAQWKETWDGPVSIESNVAFGQEEKDEAVRTLDNTLARNLLDIVDSMEEFRDIASNEKMNQEIKKGLVFAVKLLWTRTGRNDKDVNPHRSKQTHSASIDFIKDHPRLKQAVRHILVENGDEGKFTRQLKLPVGTTSSLLYLMGCDETDGDVYRNQDPPTEAKLKWGQWEKAREFWAMLGKAAKQDGTERNPFFDKVIKALAKAGNMGGSSSLAAKTGVIIKAWKLFKTGEKTTTVDSLVPKYKTNDDGEIELVEFPVLEGIDVGEGDEPLEDLVDLTQEEIDERIAAERKKKEERKEKAKNKVLKKDKKDVDFKAASQPEPVEPTPKPSKNGKPVKEKPVSGVMKEIMEVEGRYDPDTLVLFKDSTLTTAYGKNAEVLKKLLRVNMTNSVNTGVKSAAFPTASWDEMTTKLVDGGQQYVSVVRHENKWVDEADVDEQSNGAVKPVKKVKKKAK